MKFYSTNSRSTTVSLEDAVTQGLAPDNGLYMPESIPLLPNSFFETIQSKSFQEIAYEVALRVPHMRMDRQAQGASFSYR